MHHDAEWNSFQDSCTVKNKAMQRSLLLFQCQHLPSGTARTRHHRPHFPWKDPAKKSERSSSQFGSPRFEVQSSPPGSQTRRNYKGKKDRTEQQFYQNMTFKKQHKKKKHWLLTVVKVISRFSQVALARVELNTEVHHSMTQGGDVILMLPHNKRDKPWAVATWFDWSNHLKVFLKGPAPQSTFMELFSERYLS